MTRKATATKSQNRGNYRHGGAVAGARTKEYAVWCGMLKRCRTPSYEHYARYGGRGIRVCARWLKFENFLADMGPCPQGHSLERKDNDGDYAPENCVWVTHRAQSRNRSNTDTLTYRGETKPLIQWAEEVGVSYHALRARLNKLGWSVERALTTPMREQKRG